MFKRSWLLAIPPLLAIAGCGSGTPREFPVARAAHAGTLVALPDGQGFAEVLVDSAAPKAGGGKSPSKTRIVAYFFRPDGTTPMSPGPADVKMRIGGGPDSRVVDMPGEPKETGKYASAIGTYPDGFVGQLEATLDGRAVEVPVRIR